MKIKEAINKLKSDVPAVYLTLKDKRTPAMAKLFALLTVIYALSPVDLIPDFIPVLGYLDDAVILPLLIALTIKLVPSQVWAENKAKAESLWVNGKPKKWYYAIPFVAFWVIIFLLIILAICRNVRK